MSVTTLARGSSFSGGGRSFSGGSRSYSSRSYSGRSSSRYGGIRPRSGGTTHITNNVRVTSVRVYGGRTYPYRGGGWGYSYYGPHPYFDSWYGYPMYYGYPGHWSGWDWPLGILVILLLLAGIAALIGAANRGPRVWGRGW